MKLQSFRIVFGVFISVKYLKARQEKGEITRA